MFQRPTCHVGSHPNRSSPRCRILTESKVSQKSAARGFGLGERENSGSGEPVHDDKPGPRGFRRGPVGIIRRSNAERL